MNRPMDRVWHATAFPSRHHNLRRSAERNEGTGLTVAEKLAVTLNGKNLSERPFDRRHDEDGQSVREGRLLPAFDLFRFPLRDSDVKFGDNRLSVGLNSSGKRGEAVVQEIEVMVRTPAAEKPSR